MSSTFFADWFYLSIRSIKQIWRPWLALLPSLFIPLFFFGANAAAFTSVSQLPGFPVQSYLTFIAPTAIFTAAFFPAQNTGIELVLDITTGYFKKLLIMPINRLAIVLSRLAEAAFQAIVLGALVLIILLAMDVRVQTGFLGVLAMFGMLTLFAMSWASFSVMSALLTQNPRLVQSMFMVAFPVLYLTTSQMPKEYLPPAYATIATYNPATYVIEGVRALMIGSWGDPAIWQGYVISLVMFGLLLVLTLASFNKVLK